MDTEEDIGDISLKQISREAVSGNNDNRWTVERFEKAVSSAPTWLVNRWASGQAPKQIARETGQPIKDIFRMLKDLEKSITNETDN